MNLLVVSPEKELVYSTSVDSHLNCIFPGKSIKIDGFGEKGKEIQRKKYRFVETRHRKYVKPIVMTLRTSINFVPLVPKM